MEGFAHEKLRFTMSQAVALVFCHWRTPSHLRGAEASIWSRLTRQRRHRFAGSSTTVGIAMRCLRLSDGRVPPNKPAPLERRGCAAVPLEDPWRGVGEPQR